MQLKNKTAVITGCNRGIGKKILENFSRNGADIFACVRNIDKEFISYLKEIEKKNQELMREHKYLKERINNLQLEIIKKSKIEDKFNEEIEELSQETENLVSEIDKWQM